MLETSKFKKLIPVAQEWVRVEPIPEHYSIFSEHLRYQSDVLYNHSPIYPFAYLNKGTMKLFLNADVCPGNVIPVMQHHNGEAASYSLYSPISSIEKLTAAIKSFDAQSKHPTNIIDLTESYVKEFPILGWKAVKSSMDVLHSSQRIVELKGRNFSSIRNTLRRCEHDYAPNACRLSAENKVLALKVFNDWKKKQGKKYFRVTIGRDMNLIEEYFDKVDFDRYFGFVYYVCGEAKAVSFGCRSYSRDDYGIDVTVKADIDVRGLGDFAFHHLVEKMYSKGIKFVNDSSFNSPGNKINKLKWHPERLISMFSLVRG